MTEKLFLYLLIDQFPDQDDGLYVHRTLEGLRAKALAILKQCNETRMSLDAAYETVTNMTEDEAQTGFFVEYGANCWLNIRYLEVPD